MNRKLLTILFIAVFLTACVSFVSAADDIKTQDISVKLTWDDIVNLPDKVTVNLLKDNKVVDTKVLSKSNSWSAVFKNQEDDGKYSIKVNDNKDYSFHIIGDAKKGFIIKENPLDGDILGIDNETTVEDVLNTEIPSSDNEDNLTEDESGNDNQTATEEETTPTEDAQSNSTDDDNSTDDSTDNSTDDSTDNSTENSTSTDDKDDTSKDKNTKTKKTTKTKETVKTKIVKHYNKTKPENNTKQDMKKTGIPIALVLVAMIAIFVPIIRRK